MLDPSRSAVSPAATPPGQPGRKAVLVTVLHARDGTTWARMLIAVWTPVIPAAIVEPLLVDPETSLEELQARISDELLQAGLDRSSLVLAGVAGANASALQLVFGHGAVDRARLRLVWTADDPVSCSAALGRVLRFMRASGIDAQGAVLASGTRGGMDHAETARSPLANLGGAYLSELVAVALCRTTPAPAYVEDMT